MDTARALPLSTWQGVPTGFLLPVLCSKGFLNIHLPSYPRGPAGRLGPGPPDRGPNASRLSEGRSDLIGFHLPTKTSLSEASGREYRLLRHVKGRRPDHISSHLPIDPPKNRPPMSAWCPQPGCRKRLQVCNVITGAAPRDQTTLEHGTTVFGQRYKRERKNKQ